jgi:cysteine desulfurase / selenocysteine lyase
MDWNLIRSYFPATQNYVYLNPAGGSPMPIQAASEGKLFYDQMLAGGDAYWDEWLEKQEIVRHKLARFINASPDEIAFTQNTSHAMSIVAAMLEGKGNVLTMHDEFPSSTYPWLHNGFEVKFVHPENGKYTFEAIKSSLTDDIKILITSYVQYNTGFRQDLEEIGNFCKNNKLVFVINATQGMGSMLIDVKKFQADFLVFTGLKWTFAGYGIGGIYINDKWAGLLKFPGAGWRSVVEPERMDNRQLELKTKASEVELGSMSFPTIMALGGALDLLMQIGHEKIFERIMELNAYLEKRLSETGIPIETVLERKHRSGITILKLQNAREIVKKLHDKKIFVSARGAGVRVSLHIFNNFEDIDRLIQELKIII